MESLYAIFTHRLKIALFKSILTSNLVKYSKFEIRLCERDILLLSYFAEVRLLAVHQWKIMLI